MWWQKRSGALARSNLLAQLVPYLKEAGELQTACVIVIDAQSLWSKDFHVYCMFKDEEAYFLFGISSKGQCGWLLSMLHRVPEAFRLQIKAFKNVLSMPGRFDFLLLKNK